MAVALHDEAGVDETVDRVLEYAMKAVACHHAGILFVHGKKQVETVAATDDVVSRLDRVQVEHQQGPDLDVVRRPADAVLVDDVHADDRWPQWASAVAEAGIRSMLGIRLYTSSTTIGSLNFYARSAGHFTAEDVDVAHIFARHAAVALSSARETANLWRAIDARLLVGQAQGILMERFGLDAEKAFGVLRRYSQDRNIKLHVVAERLIATRRLPE
jgi:GAF domain-containing protein